MKSLKSITGPAVFFIIATVSLFFLFQPRLQAEMQPATPKPLQMQKKIPMEPAVIPALKLCPDLKVSLSISKTDSGVVTLSGTITNVGDKNYAIPSKAEYIMNLSYPPKTYAQVGVSDILLTKDFSDLKKGASLPVNFTYQVPDFDGWVDGIMSPPAKRLFTLRVVKKDMSPFGPCEDKNSGNNSASVEVGYIETQN